MKKTKIFLYHLAVFIAGSAGIAIYVFDRLATPSSGAGLGGVIVMPVIIMMYIIIFGIFCVISLGISFLISHFRNRGK
jgi:hypothetical protein